MKPRRAAFAPLLVLVALAACKGGEDDSRRGEGARGFPRATRLIAPMDASSPSSEAERDSAGEAARVMALSGIRPGMSVADIGAGEGYYTVRLAPAVGRKGRVLAEDIDSGALARLGDRVQRERLDNVSIELGDAVDPHLPPASFDRVFLIHVYNQVREPYAFLWHLRAGLRAGGSVVVVEDEVPGNRFAVPPAALFCEFSAVGFRLIQFVTKSGATGYYAQFEAIGDRPEPAAIRPCSYSTGSSARGG